MSATAPATEEQATAAQPFETLATQRVFTGDALTLDLSRFYDLEACDLVEAEGEGVEATWEDRDSGLLRLSSGSEINAIGTVTVRTRAREETHSARMPIIIERRLFHVFSFEPSEEVESLTVAGEFNGWNSATNPMSDEDGDGVYAARVAMEPGRQLYKFILNGDWMPDPANPEMTEDDYTNSILVVEGPVDSHPAWVRGGMEEREDGGVTLRIRARSEDTGQLGLLRPLRAMALIGNRLLGEASDDEGPVRVSDPLELDATISIDLPTDAGDCELRLLGVNQFGDLFPEMLIVLQDGRPVGQGDTTDSLRASVLYYAMVDRFANGDISNDDPVTASAELYVKSNWMGGDLQGVLERIEEGYFDDLGVTCLWLSPLNVQTPLGHQEYPPPYRHYTAYHGYWPISSEGVEPRFGGDDMLREVVDAAHARGIRVILDFVSNHVHEDHPLFAEQRDWFGTVELPDGEMNIQMFNEHRFTTWFDLFLPSFDYPGAPEAIEHMTDNAMWWIETYGLDGFRHDAVKHIPLEFWTTLTRKVRRHERETGQRIFQIGETIDSRGMIMEYCRGGMLDGQFDFPLYWPLRQTLATRREPLTGLAEAMDQSVHTYGPEPLMSALIGNHDVPRFMGLADGHLTGNESVEDQRNYGFENDGFGVSDPENYRLLEVAFTFLMTQPQIPMIFYGDEVGLTGAQDPDNRRMVQWDGLTEDQLRVRELVMRLTHLRREHPALWSGDFLTVDVTDDTWVYARVNFDEVILVALNRGDDRAEIEIALPEILGVDLGASLEDLLTGADATLEAGRLSIDMPGRSARVLQIDRD